MPLCVFASFVFGAAEHPTKDRKRLFYQVKARSYGETTTATAIDTSNRLHWSPWYAMMPQQHNTMFFLKIFFIQIGPIEIWVLERWVSMKIHFICEKTSFYHNCIGSVDRYLSYVFILCTNHSGTHGDRWIGSIGLKRIVKKPERLKSQNGLQVYINECSHEKQFRHCHCMNGPLHACIFVRQTASKGLCYDKCYQVKNLSLWRI